MPAPKSLFTEKAKANGSYEKTDVVEQLRKDFHNKCYICEIDNLQDPQVEHLRTHFNGNTDVQAVDSEDEDAKMTAELVMEVFNKTNSGMRVYKSHMRFEELNREMSKLYSTLEELSHNPDSTFVLKKLKALIRRESRFAAFKRCYIRENVAKYIDYLE